ncbi:MAG: type II secretion system protein [Phycisphaerae bacterium]|nr:type II secretion system protein [Phycisphaerae bacterium]
MTCRISSRRREGFSLVELLAVVGIIALLIAILVPSLNVATRRAKSTATLNTIRVLETAVETFKADMAVGGAYPESAVLNTASPHVPNATIQPSGASLLLWALVGADGLGTPGFLDPNGNGTWRDNTGCSPTDLPNNLYAINDRGTPDRSDDVPFHTRYGPFVAIENMRAAEEVRDPPVTGPLRGFRIERYRQYSGPAEQYFSSSFFLDTFDRPILYFRANPVSMGIPMAGNAPNAACVYNLNDNFAFTQLDLGAGRAHPLARLGNLNNPAQGPNPNDPKSKLSFAYTIWDSSVSTIIRPQRPDSFILLSCGPDGLYGTRDDIGNIKIADR